MEQKHLKLLAGFALLLPPQELAGIRQTFDLDYFQLLEKKYLDYLAAVARWEQSPNYPDGVTILRTAPGQITKSFVFATKAEQTAVFDWSCQHGDKCQKLSTLLAEGRPQRFDSEDLDAEYSLRVMDLVDLLWPRSKELRSNFSCPEETWFAWETSILYDSFLKSGLLTGNGKFPPSKQSLIDGVLDLTGWMAHKRNLSGEPSIRSNQGSAWELIQGICHQEATDPTIANSSELEAFSKCLKRMASDIRKNSGNAPRTFQDGKLLPSGRKANSHLRKKNWREL